MGTTGSEFPAPATKRKVYTKVVTKKVRYFCQAIECEHKMGSAHYI